MLPSALVVPLLETAMDDVHRSRLTDSNWLSDEPTGPFFDALKQHLTERRYAASNIASYLSSFIHFARWARTRRQHPTPRCVGIRRRTPLMRFLQAL